jgi:bacterioferritin-associated ferredoxin
MIVCQCKGTTDAVVRKAIRNGARTVGEIGAMCLAGTDCEGCHDTLIGILRAELQNREEAKASATMNSTQPLK